MNPDPAAAFMIKDRSTFELAGRTFEVPSLVWGLDASDPGQRLVAGVAPTAEVRSGVDVVLVDDFSPGALDLRLVRSGRCPLLIDHARTFDGLIGAVADAWVEDGALCFVGRLAEGGEADRIWGLLTQGFPLSVSIGSRVVAAEDLGPAPDGPGQRYRLSRWRLVEVSVTVAGRDPDAHLHSLDRSPEARERLAKKAREAAENSRTSVYHALHLDRWERWATGAGSAIAERLGADRDRVCDALDEQVRRHVERLQHELAG